VYDVRTGRLAATLGGHLEAATDVAFSPLHPQLATVSPVRVRVRVRVRG